MLALSVPECAARVGSIVERRTQLNELIANYEAYRWWVQLFIHGGFGILAS